MVRGRRLIANQKGHPVHSDIHVMLRKTLSEKEDQMFEMFEVRTQKSPQGFHLAGSQDLDDGSGNHQPRILVGWRSLKKVLNFMN